MTAPYFPPGTSPITPEAKARLDLMLQVQDADKALKQKLLDAVTKSGISDTLQAILGKHEFSAPDSLRSAFRGPREWGATSAVNRFNNRIEFSPEFLKERVPRQGDNPGDQYSPSGTLAHEFGHTAEDAKALNFEPDERGFFRKFGEIGEGKPWTKTQPTLLEQWFQSAKTDDLDTKEDLTHPRGYWVDAKGGIRQGANEIFASSFAETVNFLRRNWDVGDRKKMMAELKDLERVNPGMGYLAQWLTQQPQYKSHPFAVLRRTERP